jgi:hypothetical protein
MQRSARIARHVVGSAPAATEVAELRPVDWPDDIPVPAYVPPRLLGPSSSPLLMLLFAAALQSARTV